MFNDFFIKQPHPDPQMWGLFVYIRVRVREQLSATPGHVIGQGPAPGGRVVPRGGGYNGINKR